MEEDADKLLADAVSVRITEFLVATSDASDELIDRAVGHLLRRVRDALHMDVVFVAEFVDGQRVFRHVEVPSDTPVLSVGQFDPLEQTWCQRVVDGRLPQMIPNVAKLPGKAELPVAPFDIGTHLSTPIVLPDGRIYGTLCCFSFNPVEDVQHRDFQALQAVSEVLARYVRPGSEQASAKQDTVRRVENAP